MCFVEVAFRRRAAELLTPTPHAMVLALGVVVETNDAKIIDIGKM